MRLPQSFYDRSVHKVARELIGCVVRHGETAGRIVETESYHMEEPACHAFAGVTDRTSTLFGEPGNAYIYFSYGIHSLLNAVAEEPGVGAAVLIRALEPVDGAPLMRQRRGVPFREAHGIVGGVVLAAVERGKKLSELTQDELTELAPQLDGQFYDLLDEGSWLESKVSDGGTSMARVRDQLAQARQVLREAT